MPLTAAEDLAHADSMSCQLGDMKSCLELANNEVASSTAGTPQRFWAASLVVPAVKQCCVLQLSCQGRSSELRTSIQYRSQASLQMHPELCSFVTV
jgi:hypothetical protein